MADEDAYEVSEDEAGFRVQDAAGVNIMTCRDRRSAEHYAVLLNRAFRKGYKLGFRVARRGSDAS